MGFTWCPRQAIWPYLLVSTTLPSLELRPLDSQADLQLGLRVWVKSTAYGYRDLAGREGEIVRVRGNFADVACQPGEGNFHFSELLARRGAAGVTAPHDPPPRASRPASGQGGYHSHQHNATPPGGPGPNTESRRVKRWGDGLDAPAAGSRNFFPQGFQVTLEVPEAIQRFGHSVARVSDIMETGRKHQRHQFPSRRHMVLLSTRTLRSRPSSTMPCVRHTLTQSSGNMLTTLCTWSGR